MIPLYLLPHTVTLVTVVEGASVDRYGNPVTEETETAGVRAYVQPSSASEDIINRDTRVTDYNVFLLSSASVDGLSKIIWEGLTLAVDGEPARFDTPSGPHHIEVKAQRIDG